MAVTELDFSFDYELHFQGWHFFKSAAVLKDNPVHYSRSPYYVLLAFSIELMLKSLRVKRTVTTSKDCPSKVNSVKVEHVKGHSLIQIYNNHPQEIKSWLSASIFKESNIDLEDVLVEHADLFDKARYIYPRNGNMDGASGYSVNESALYSVGEFLASIPELLRGN